MTSEASFASMLETHFEHVHVKHMQGLPILNSRLRVEAVAARDFGEHEICVLITPWFMNLAIRPAAGHWEDRDEGELISIDLPHETLDFNLSRIDDVGRVLTAVLFRTMTDFPDQQIATEIAVEIMDRLFSRPEPAEQKTINRRALLTGLEAS